MQWQVLFLDKRVRAELEAQPKDIQARFLRIAELIVMHGLERVHEPYIKHLEGPLWEMRMKGKDGIARAVYGQAASASSWCGCSTRKRKRPQGVKLI